jgi:hypothetical protein
MYDLDKVPKLGTFAELLDWFLSAKKSRMGGILKSEKSEDQAGK